MIKIQDPRLWLCAVALAAVSSACGDDDDNNNDNGRAGTSNAGTTSRSGAGGTSNGPGGTGGTSNGQGGAGASANEGGSTSDAGEPSTSGGAALGGAPNPEAGAGGEAMGGAGGASPLGLSDAQVLLVLDTLNQGEVEVAYAAFPRLADVDVQAFAQQMITDHSAARQEVLGVASTLAITPLPSGVQMMLKAKAEAKVAMFHMSGGATLDEPYVDSQVADHAAALTLLTELADEAEAAELDELIAALQLDVQAHHEEALELQAALP